MRSKINTLKNKLRLILYIFSIFIFTSCEDSGQIDGLTLEPDQDDYIGNNFNPNGQNFGHVGDLYFNMLDDSELNENFWRFNYFHLNGGSHNGPGSDGEQDILTLKSYQNTYYVPSTDFEAPCFLLQQENQTGEIEYDVPVYTDEDDCVNNLGGLWFGDDDIAFVFDGQGYVPASGVDLTTEVTMNTDNVAVESSLDLKTPPLSSDSPLDQMSWSIGENMYSFSTMDQIKDTLSIEYSYNYNLDENFVPLDNVLNTIIEGSVIISDIQDTLFQARTYDVFDTLKTEGQEDLPILISREHKFYSYKNQLNFDFGQRQTTDCNDNYRKDDSEPLLSDYESECADNGGNWTENEDNACLSFCSIGDNSVTFDDWCWNEYVSDNRLTGRCFASNSSAFCDRGNALYDGAEILYDVCPGDCDGENGNVDVIGQGIEPFEDRNCNNLYDSQNEALLTDFSNQLDCELNYGTWSSEGFCFLDSGNSQHDGVETCYGDLDECSYMGLYNRGLAPDYLLVSYQDGSNPSYLTDIYAGDVFKDCGLDNKCNEEEDGFNPGTCADGFSGSQELCCKHNSCWNYNLNSCDFSLQDCDEQSAQWSENLDPAADDCTNCAIDPISGNLIITDGSGIANGTERNFTYDFSSDAARENILVDFNGIDEDNDFYSAPTLITTKFLNYSDCVEGFPSDECGGQEFEIISDTYEISTATSSVQKEKSIVNVSSHPIIGQLPEVVSNLNKLNIIKTQWPDSDEYDGTSEDYMLLMESDNLDENGMHYIIKLNQPYYYYANTPYTGVFETLPSSWWQTLNWEQDTLIYSSNGSIIDGQSWYSNYSVESDTANYIVHKEYEVSMENAELRYYQSNLGSCISDSGVINQNVLESDCPDLNTWVVNGQTIEDCIKVTRTITTTMLGPGIDFKLKSETYLKEGFPVVKEDIYWSWPPTFEGERIFTKISSIEACGLECESVNSDQNFSNYLRTSPSQLNINDFNGSEILNFDAFKLTNTMGLQRVVVPE